MEIIQKRQGRFIESQFEGFDASVLAKRLASNDTLVRKLTDQIERNNDLTNRLQSLRDSSDEIETRCALEIEKRTEAEEQNKSLKKKVDSLENRIKELEKEASLKEKTSNETIRAMQTQISSNELIDKRKFVHYRSVCNEYLLLMKLFNDNSLDNIFDSGAQLDLVKFLKTEGYAEPDGSICERLNFKIIEYLKTPAKNLREIEIQTLPEIKQPIKRPSMITRGTSTAGLDTIFRNNIDSLIDTIFQNVIVSLPDPIEKIEDLEIQEVHYINTVENDQNMDLELENSFKDSNSESEEDENLEMDDSSDSASFESEKNISEYKEVNDETDFLDNNQTIELNSEPPDKLETDCSIYKSSAAISHMDITTAAPIQCRLTQMWSQLNDQMSAAFEKNSLSETSQLKIFEQLKQIQIVLDSNGEKNKITKACEKVPKGEIETKHFVKPKVVVSKSLFDEDTPLPSDPSIVSSDVVSQTLLSIPKVVPKTLLPTLEVGFETLQPIPVVKSDALVPIPNAESETLPPLTPDYEPKPEQLPATPEVTSEIVSSIRAEDFETLVPPQHVETQSVLSISVVESKKLVPIPDIAPKPLLSNLNVETETFVQDEAVEVKILPAIPAKLAKKRSLALENKGLNVHDTCLTDFSPESPTNSDDEDDSLAAQKKQRLACTTKTIPLNRISNRIVPINEILDNYDTSKRKEIINQFAGVKSASDEEIERKIICILNQYVDDEWNVENIYETYCKPIIECTQTPKLIFEAIASVTEIVPLEKLSTLTFRPPGPNLPIVHKKMLVLVRRLTCNITGFDKTCCLLMERRLFRLKFDSFNIKKYLSLAVLHNGLMDMSAGSKSKARLFIYKCLYYYGFKAMPIIYVTLVAFPNVLPHTKRPLNGISDPIVRAIQYVLMSFDYSNKLSDTGKHVMMQNSELFTFMMRNYGYHKGDPSSEVVVRELVDKIKSNDFRNVSYGLILVAKRANYQWASDNIIQLHLYPLLQKSLQETQSSSRDARIMVCISTIASILKTFPNAEGVRKFQHLFVNIFQSSDNHEIQEVAVQSLLKLSRFGMGSVFKQSSQWHPQAQINRKLSIMFKSFIYRKSSGHWKKITSNCV